ncbi:hypothetical protein NC651_030755 [Populus alba x Populus x berolinensis]|nr:hypothetical protein NC651_030755 [Populus alba x Populus x berolinensis]
MDMITEELDDSCPGWVLCADTLALATRYVTEPSEIRNESFPVSAMLVVHFQILLAGETVLNHRMMKPWMRSQRTMVTRPKKHSSFPQGF